jgi:hypothetical protein
MHLRGRKWPDAHSGIGSAATIPGMTFVKRRPLRFTLYALLAFFIMAAGSRMHANDWRTASREPVGLAPDPAVVKEAVLQVYGARTIGAKGLFGVHTWVAAKPSDAAEWTVYEVIGWRLGRAPSVVVVRSRLPDGRWFGAVPELYAERRGEGVDQLIERVEKAARDYPYATEYRAWPGPNSNTFTAWIARAVPELQIDLPATAIGKDYLGSSIVGTAPSGSGFQLSLGGVLGIAASGVDGLELNVLGLNFGVGPNGLKLPIVGRIGQGFRAQGAAPPAGVVDAAAPVQVH